MEGTATLYMRCSAQLMYAIKATVSALASDVYFRTVAAAAEAGLLMVAAVW